MILEEYAKYNAIEKCRIYASEFDHTIYPKNFELMGHPDGTLGDIDGDPRITVFLVEGVGSYYLQHNELPFTTYSNNREMVFVNSNMELYNTIEVICHETNHLFLFNYDLNEGRYFIEGLAEFSTYYVGYRNNYSFVQWSEVSLNSTHTSYFFSHYPDASMLFFDETYHSSASYGASYMFLLYVSEKYGMNIISELVPIDELDGPEALEYVLSSNGYNISFNEVFLNFITASTIDQLGIYDDLYGFVNTEFQIYERRYIRSFPSNSIDTLYRYYGTNVQELVEPLDEFTLQIETPASPQSLGLSAVIFDENGYNISQTILTGTGNTTYLYFTGENIESVYIITSMIKEGTPNSIREWMPSP
ncbi:MAG: hypothetical protein KGD64_11025, partial [Candidatus Heimdallarchaeota archaeon]|nr:hypothetical protein [Candidatus Heimdallarchaeota archaeon]